MQSLLLHNQLLSPHHSICNVKKDMRLFYYPRINFMR